MTVTSELTCRTSQCSNRAVLLCCLLLLAAHGDSNADETVSKDPPSATFAKLFVKVADADGAPIAGVEVRPWAMELEGRNGHFAWGEEVLGEPETATSSSEGIAIVRYPLSFELNSSEVTPSLLSFQCCHPEFVTVEVHFPLGQPDTVVKMERGVQASFSAVDDENDLPIRDFGVLVSGPSQPERWLRGPNGELKTGVLSRSAIQALVVAPQSDGGVLFSDVILVDGSKTLSHEFLKTPLERGRRIEGRLADNVTRPVQNGYVVVSAAPFPLESSDAIVGSSVVWQDRVEIALDGTFVIPSIPHSGEMQLIAICDNWHATPSANVAFISGELIDLDDEVSDLILPMFPAVTLEVTVTDQAGHPVSGVFTDCSPNQQLKWFGSSLLGTSFRTSILIEDQISNRARSKFWQMNESFKTVTDQQGKARIHSVPLIRSADPVRLYHPEFEDPEATFLKIPPDENGVIHLKVKLEPRGRQARIDEPGR